MPLCTVHTTQAGCSWTLECGRYSIMCFRAAPRATTKAYRSGGMVLVITPCDRPMFDEQCVPLPHGSLRSNATVASAVSLRVADHMLLGICY